MLRSNPSSRLGILTLVLAALVASLAPGVSYGQADPPAIVRAEYLPNVAPGDTVTLAITLDSVGAFSGLSGFDLLIQYDPGGMTLIGANLGSLPDGCGWEYFNYRSDTVGLVRLVAVADINNGAGAHPMCLLNAPGTLADLQFTVTSNPTWAGYYLPLFFYWQDCGDNTFASSAGDSLFVSNRVFTFDGYDITDGSMLPGQTGAPAECLTGSPETVLRGVDFIHGGVVLSADTMSGTAAIVLDSRNNIFIGDSVNLGVNFIPAAAPVPLGGFDLLLRYDRSVLHFTGATPGALLDTCAWEYFTYRTDSIGADNLVRVVGIADINDANTPLCYAQVAGPLADLSFLVPFDSSLFGVTTDLEWFWADCGDNTLTNAGGDTLFFSNDVHNADGFPITADSALPGNTGAPDACLNGGGGIRSVDFFSGRVRIAGDVLVDYRGDVNLNGIPYEIADYNLFLDYFRFGAGVFAVDSALQIATTDVNADGLVLTLDDLIFLYAITRGTEQPGDYHYGGYDTVDFQQDAAAQTISYSGVDSLAAVLLTFQGPVTPTLANASIGMHLWSEFDGFNTRVVIYPSYDDSLDLLPGVFAGTMMTYTGNGTLQSAVAADYLQQILTARVFSSSGDSLLPRFVIGVDDYVILGDTIQIPIDLINVSNGFEIAGFNFTIQYDAGPLTLLGVQPGQLLQDCGWEIFSWGDNPPPDCDSSCSQRLITMVSLADGPAIPGNPSCYADHSGRVATMTFVVSDSDLYNCVLTDIKWRWYSCSDNSLSTLDGELLLPNGVFTMFDNPETPVDSFPNSSGITSSCPPGIARTFDLQHGAAGINCVDPIDDRGDLNLNGIPYEIADYVTYANYLLYGMSAFFQPEAQTAASDVNFDGVPLTLDDFIYLYRVVIGQVLPFPRPSVTPAATAVVTQDGATSTVRIQYPDSITAAWFVFGGDVDATCAFPSHVATAVWDSSQYTRILVLPVDPFDSLVSFPSTDTSTVVISYTGSGTLLWAELASDGIQQIPVSLAYNQVPSCCQLRGNVNGIDGVNIADLTALVGHLFQGTFPPPPCPDEADVDASGESSPLTVSDITYLVSYLFQGGAPPPPCQ